jgi:hypothetical protein
MTPFYINYGYHPTSGTAPPSTSSLPFNSIAYGHWMKAVHKDCKNELQKTSEPIKKHANKARINPPTYETGNLVMVNGKNLKTYRPAQKLDPKL